MDKLSKSIEQLKHNEVGKLIVSRLNQFSLLRKRNITEIFKELCFCIMTANFQAEKSIFIQKEIGNGFLNLSENELANKLKQLGHRFPNTRAKYICEARKFKDKLTENLKNLNISNLNKHSKQYNEFKIREWLVENIKGIGYKEASHFLRNIGFTNLAIIDFHIIDILNEHKLIQTPKNKSLSRTSYIEIEKRLGEIAKKTKLSLAELDLYLWYMETGKVLK